MEFLTWLQDNGFSLQNIVSLGGLFFAGFALLIDAKARRVGNLLELTKQHRELWIWIHSRPDLKRVFDHQVDLESQPLTDDERRSVNFIILHFAANYRAAKEGVFRLPRKIGIDIQGFFSRPVPRAVWEKMKQFHEEDYVRFIEENW